MKQAAQGPAGTDSPRIARVPSQARAVDAERGPAAEAPVPPAVPAAPGARPRLPGASSRGPGRSGPDRATPSVLPVPSAASGGGPRSGAGAGAEAAPSDASSGAAAPLSGPVTPFPVPGGPSAVRGGPAPVAGSPSAVRGGPAPVPGSPSAARPGVRPASAPVPPSVSGVGARTYSARPSHTPGTRPRPDAGTPAVPGAPGTARTAPAAPGTEPRRSTASGTEPRRSTPSGAEPRRAAVPEPPTERSRTVDAGAERTRAGRPPAEAPVPAPSSPSAESRTRSFSAPSRTPSSVPSPPAGAAPGSDSAVSARPSRPVVQRASVRGQILDALRAALVSGELEPGEVYSAPVLGERFGVSATPVREAMQQLALEGAVEVVPNRGFRVVRRGARELAELAEIRALIEVPVVLRLAGTLPAERWADLRPLAEATVSAATAGNRATYADADRAFHRALLVSAGNEQLVRVAEDLHRRSQWPLVDGPRAVARPDLAADAAQHIALLDALAAGDTDRACALLTAHLRGASG